MKSALCAHEREEIYANENSFHNEKSFPLCAASLILLALTMCQCNDDDRVGDLEELPEEIAANLKVVLNTDLLISMPPFEVRKPVATATPKNCASTEHSYVQVIFPITICYPPDFSTNGLLKEYRLAPDREPFPPPAGQTQNAHSPPSMAKL